MREAEAEHEVLALHLSSVADAYDFEDFLEAFGDADDHVVDEGSRHAVGGADGLVVVCARDGNCAVRNGDGDVVHDIHLEGALSAFDGHMLAVDRYVYALGKRYGFASYSRHFAGLPTRRSR